MKNVITINKDNPELSPNDLWQLAEEDAPAGKGPHIMPFSWFTTREEQLDEKIEPIGVWLGPDDEVEALEPWLKYLSIIAVHFPNFREGRAYTQAYMLRTRLGWTGELRAFGDVLRDQLSHMRQCGFTSFAIREDKSSLDAIKGLSGISVLYGNSVIQPLPLFRRKVVTQ